MTKLRRRARSRNFMSALTCGLDVHKDWTDVTVRRNTDGEIVVGVRKLPNERILDFLREHPDISRVAMEASTSVVPLYRELKEAGYDDVLVSHPKKTRLIAESVIKSDRVDSEALSELARLSALPLAYIPPPEVAKLREKVRRRAFLVRMRTKLKNKVRMQLLYEGIKEPKENEYGLFTRKGAEWLSSLKLDSVDMYMRLIGSLNAEVKALSDELKTMAPLDEDARLLMTIPGVGYYSALLIKSEIGSIDRFPDGEHLCSYAGLVTSVSQSGKRRRYGPITKEGSAWLRWVMVECAHVHIKQDTSITRAYHAIAQSKGKGVAAVAAARRLLMCCYSVLKNRRPYYDPSGHYKSDDDQAN
jgi:transposase